MYIDLYKDQMRPAELFGKQVLYSEQPIAREEVPEGWHCYDLCGTDRKPDQPLKLTDLAVVYRAGTVLSPQPLKKATTAERKVKDLVLTYEEPVTLAEFCHEHDLPLPQDPRKFTLRPASPEEAGLFFAQTPERDVELGAIGHVRMDFGRGGKDFYHSWWPRGPEELNTQAFKAELQEVVDELRKTVLKSLGSMRRYCWGHSGEINGGSLCQNYGFTVETERYLYRLRCNPAEGDYQAYLSCFDKQAQHMGLTEKGRRMLGDAADPALPHTYDWYVIEHINTPERRLDHHLPLEEAIPLYASLDCGDKRLGVTKDGTVSADYTGTVSRIALNKTRYVAIFEGTPLQPVEPAEEISDIAGSTSASGFNWPLLLVPLGLIAAAGVGIGIALFLKRRNELAEGGDGDA